MLVATEVIPSQRGDDPLYFPTIARVLETPGQWGAVCGRLENGRPGDPRVYAG
jgi:hypothetical protein